MEIAMRYFGRIAEVIGKEKELWESENITQVKGVKQKLENQYPKLREEEYAIAVNHKIEELEAAISTTESIEIAILPPFAGG